MKKLLILAAAVLMLAGCGVGGYSIASGKLASSKLSVTAPAAYAITVHVDDNIYNISTVKTSAFKNKVDLKETAKNTIKVEPGTHEVKIYIGDRRVYSKKHVFSDGEQKVIEL
ncbi:MAG: hypothetical protein MJY89_06970 [Bacteroidales bacterium]|nr:hypothetical protein [Bacteroidales bacterium]